MILACCVATAFGAVAQQQVLKDADRAMKSEGPKRHDIRAMLKGAMTNAETANDVKTWYLAGKNEFGNWNDLYQILPWARMRTKGYGPFADRCLRILPQGTSYGHNKGRV